MRFEDFKEGTRCWKGYKKKGMKTMFGKRVPNCVKNEADLEEASISSTRDAIEVLAQLRGKGKQLERGQQEYKGNLPNEYVNDVYDVYTWMENKLGGFPAGAPDKLKPILKDVMALRGEAKKMERVYKPDLQHSDDHMGAAAFANLVVNTLYPLMQWLDMNDQMFEGTTQCKDGEYYCNDSKQCKPIPPGHYVDDTGYLVKEDLRAWFGKGKKGGAGGGGWDRYNTKGERIGKCGDSKPGEGKPKCLSKSKAASLRSSGGKKAIANAVKRKRKKDPNPDRRGKAKNVKNKVKEYGVGIVTKQNATKDVPVGGEYMNVKKLSLDKKPKKKRKLKSNYTRNELPQIKNKQLENIKHSLETIDIKKLIPVQEERILENFKKQVDNIVAGDYNPIIIDTKNRIVNGHHRYTALQMLGIKEADVARLPFTLEKILEIFEADHFKNPKNTFLTKADTAYDFLRIGKHVANIKSVKKGANRDEPDVMVVPFGGEKEKKHLKKHLNRIGYKTQDADKHGDDGHVDESLREALGEIKKNSEIYVDMDGVLADFFGEWSKSQGVDNWKDIKNPAQAIGDIKDIDDFWLNLPLLPKAKELLGLIKQVKGSYSICTSPLADDPRSEPHKREWIKNNLSFFPPKNVFVTHNKAQFATQKDGTPNILIDDFGKNIESWENAGGIGFKYKDYKFQRTAKEIKQKIKEPATENFADGKKKGKSRPGRVKRSGASCKGSVTDLRKRAKNSSGEKRAMYHWCANMKSGRSKK